MTTQDPSTSIKAEPAARETVRGPQTSLDGPLMHDFEMFLHSLFGADADGLCMHLRRQEDGALLVNSLPSTSVGMEKWTHAAVLALAAEGRLTGAFFEGLLARIPRRASEILALQRRILGEASIVTEPTRSHALVFQGQFLQQPTIISPNEVLAALHPVLPYGEPESISLKAIDLRDPEAWNAAQAPLREQLTRFLEKKVRPTTHPHVSVFGLGPTPWLVALGNYLGDTLPTSLHGRLRSPPTWSWQVRLDRRHQLLAPRGDLGRELAGAMVEVAALGGLAGPAGARVDHRRLLRLPGLARLRAHLRALRAALQRNRGTARRCFPFAFAGASAASSTPARRAMFTMRVAWARIGWCLSVSQPLRVVHEILSFRAISA
jgi:hypothetical protein